MRGIERAYPGATRERNGKVSRFHWPTFPWTKGSYSCYKPGQWTTIAGSEGLPVGNLFFAGEHCSYDFQGYMNGAAQSGADTAKAVMAKVSGIGGARLRRATRAGRHDGSRSGASDDGRRRIRRSGMRLTGAGKFLLFLVGLGVLGYAGWTYRDQLPGGMPGTGAPSRRRAARPRRRRRRRRRPPARKGVLGSDPADRRAARRHGSRTRRRCTSSTTRKQEDGFDFRLAGIVAEGLGAKRVQVVEADYEDLPDRLRAGDIDVIMAGYVPDPSIEGVVWSNGYLDFGLCMIVHEGMVVDLPVASDLAGKRIAIYDDPAAERWVKENIPNARISKFSGDDGWFEAVETDQADALIYDYPFAAEEIKAHPRTIDRASTTSTSRSTRSAIPEGNYDLVYEVNAAIDKFRATPQYADLMREYLSSSSEVFMKPVAGRKTYTVKAGDTLSKIAGSRAQGHEPLEGDLGSQPRSRGEREPDLSAARAADAVAGLNTEDSQWIDLDAGRPRIAACLRHDHASASSIPWNRGRRFSKRSSSRSSTRLRCSSASSPRLSSSRRVSACLPKKRRSS